MNAELLRFPLLCWHYYKLITFACEICPAKIVSLPPDMLSNLFASLQLGLTTFGSDIAALCFEFIHVRLYTFFFKSSTLKKMLSVFLLGSIHSFGQERDGQSSPRSHETFSQGNFY